MRISTNMQFDRHLRSLMNTSGRLDKANERLLSGDKFATAGEDPFGMSQKMGLTTNIELYQQYTTNGNLLQSTLSHEETVLSSINDNLLSTTTLLQKIQNGAMSDGDLQDLGHELEMRQAELYDLMNSKDPQGEYLFSGNQTQTQPFAKDANGRYVFQGDAGVRSVQVSPSVSIQASDSGHTIFETAATRRTASPLTGNNNISILVSDQGAYDTYYKNNYDTSSTASNSFIFNTIAGTPDTYEITDSGGTVLKSGDYVAGEALDFNGLSITVDVATGGSQSFQMDSPTNDNILNSLSDIIAVLKDPSSFSGDELQQAVADVQTHMSHTRDQVGTALWQTGARMNTLDSVLASNGSLEESNTEARAAVSEIDMYQAITDLYKEQNALSVAQQTFGKLQQQSLFDYLR